MVCSVNTGKRTHVWHVILVGLFLELPSVASAATPFSFQRKTSMAFWDEVLSLLSVTDAHWVTPVASELVMAYIFTSSHDGALLCCPHLRTSWQIKWLGVKVQTWRLKEKEEPGKCFLGIGEDINSSIMSVRVSKLQCKINKKLSD